MPDEQRSDLPVYFRLFLEIGILEQLSRALLEAKLPAGLLVSHFGVISHLSRGRDGETPLDLARAFQVPKTTMTHTLAGLEKHDFVEMRPNPKDKRSKQVWLTEAGMAFRDQAIAALRPKMSEMAEEFDPQKIDALCESLGTLRIWMDENRES